MAIDLTQIAAVDFACLCHNEMCREIVLGQWQGLGEPVLWERLDKADQAYLTAVARRVLSTIRRK
jgi:hypothetical protein